MVSIHPGEYIRLILEDNDVSIESFAEKSRISLTDVKNLINGKQDITPEIAHKLEVYFYNLASFWLNLQKNYDATGDLNDEN